MPEFMPGLAKHIESILAELDTRWAGGDHRRVQAVRRFLVGNG
ncbi:hypothetical protein [Streptomyces finlayi]|nr:hypothetical protein [Streptomyces finlayi]